MKLTMSYYEKTFPAAVRTFILGLKLLVMSAVHVTILFPLILPLQFKQTNLLLKTDLDMQMKVLIILPLLHFSDSQTFQECNYRISDFQYFISYNFSVDLTNLSLSIFQQMNQKAFTFKLGCLKINQLHLQNFHIHNNVSKLISLMLHCLHILCILHFLSKQPEHRKP